MSSFIKTRLAWVRLRIAIIEFMSTKLDAKLLELRVRRASLVVERIRISRELRGTKIIAPKEPE